MTMHAAAVVSCNPAGPRSPCRRQPGRPAFPASPRRASCSAKAWRDIWGAGQGVGLMDDVPTAADMVARLKAEYDAARARLAL
jgi:NAD(P)H-dependent flavin oxidoreductase YrpB (nitropropane dioxygenase family)